MEKKRRARWRTSVCLNLAMVFERADEVILPAAYSFVARSFAATPSDLANITLARALVQAVCSPLGGVLGMSTTCLQGICLPMLQGICCSSACHICLASAVAEHKDCPQGTSRVAIED